MTKRKSTIGVNLVLVAALAWAASYAFHISAAGPSFASTTFESDRVAEFDGANAIARQYLQYLSISSQMKIYLGQGDTVYVSYHDGRIGKFTMISPTNTIRLRFERQVETIPADARKNGFESSGAVSDGPNVGVSARMDYIEVPSSIPIFYEEYRKSASVTVIQYVDGAACGDDCGQGYTPSSIPQVPDPAL